MRPTSFELAAMALLLALAATSPSAGQDEKANASTAPDAWSAPPVPEFGDLLDREELVEAVLSRNPDVAAAKAGWRAALARVPQARSLEDPMASYSIAPLTLGTSQSRIGQELRLSQRLPWPGTLPLRRQAAEAEAAAAEQQVDEVRLRLAAMARSLFDEYWRVTRSQGVTEDHLRLLGEMKQVATARYAAGLVPQQAPLQAEVEAGHARHEAIELEADRDRVIAQIDALLHRPVETGLPPPADLLVPVQNQHPTNDEVGAPAAITERPDLRALRQTIAAKQLRVTLQRRGRYPELEAMTSFESLWDAPEQRWMVGVGVNLPIRRQRIRAGIEEAQADLEESQAELASREDAARAEVATATAGLREASHEIELYRDGVLPASRDQVSAARAAFETGAADMLALIDAERSLRIAEVEYIKARADFATWRAELDRARGLPPGMPRGPGTLLAPAAAEPHQEDGQ